MVRQAGKVAFSHLSRWTSKPLQDLADVVAGLAPGSLNKLYLISGGSEATESALKMARQYYVERDGQSSKYRIISRWNSFHGNTLGSLSMTGDKRRKKYTPLLLNFPHIAPAYCYRCPFGKKPDCCEVDCALDLERCLKMEGPEYVAAFIGEPVGGAACGAIVPHPDYYKIVRQICDHYDILLIDDEVMAGFGRTGSMFAIEAFGVVLDLICAAKGMSAGYSPLGAVIAKEEIYEVFKNGSGVFVHGHTYGGNPLSAAVALSVIDVLQKDKVVENARTVGAHLLAQLQEKLLPFPFVGDVRGKGLLLGVEIVKDKATKEPYPVGKGMAEKITQVLIKHGVIVYPGNLYNALELQKAGLLQGPLLFNLVLGVKGSLPANAKNLFFLLDLLPADAQWSVSVIGPQHVNLSTIAIALGGHVRVGIEDNIYYSKGVLATNVALVDRIVGIARAVGREIAEPGDVGRIWGCA